MDRFIIDAGPFIHLEQIGQLKLLKKLSSLVLPASVAVEIRQGAATRSLKTIKSWPNIKIISVQRESLATLDALIEKAGLQVGETDCIQLCLKMRPCVLLTDDLSARITVEKLSIEVHGTVGIIAYAFRRKWLSLKKAEESLNLLYHRSSLFITYAIIEEAIRSLKNSR